MKESEAFYRYAKALFRMSANQEIDTTLSGCVHLMTQVPDFIPFLEHPQINHSAKVKVLHTCIQNPLIVRFLTVLMEWKHLKQLPKIAQEYHRLILEKLDLMEGHLTSAFPLDQNIINQLKKRLEELFNHTFTLETKIDPALIGGTLLFVGGRLVDFSFKGRLEALKNDLLRGSRAP